jgi:RND superfamily putative drug exporter
MQLLLTALVLGAGTDYGLFLLFCYREYLAAGLDPTRAVVAAVERVGESVTFSAATVIAALLSLLLASFGLYRGVGPGLAIGIAVVLLVELTLFPALLSILGPAVFWPARPAGQPRRSGAWAAVAARVSGRPAAALTSHFGSAALDDTDLVLRLRRSVWEDPGLIEAGQDRLAASGAFSSVADALSGTGGSLPEGLFTLAHRLLGPPGALPAVAPNRSPVPLPVYDAYRSTAQSITDDGRTILYRVSLRAGSPGSTAALQAVPTVRRITAAVGRSLGATEWGVAGQAAGAADVSAVAGRDILTISPVVLVVLAALLAAVLRSLVAPLYLVASVALSYAASLGLAVLLFVVVGHGLGVNFTLPFLMFVFVLALGEDYNILVMTRIREENERLPLRPAVAAALGTTGTTVTSAGLVLAGTFGVLALVASGQVRQIATGLSLGVLLDTFVVRTLVVPSTVVLLGRWNWWPSRRRTADLPSKEAAAGAP